MHQSGVVPHLLRLIGSEDEAVQVNQRTRMYRQIGGQSCPFKPEVKAVQVYQGIRLSRCIRGRGCQGKSGNEAV